MFPFEEHYKGWLFAMFKTALTFELKLIFVKIWALKYQPFLNTEYFLKSIVPVMQI